MIEAVYGLDKEAAVEAYSGFAEVYDLFMDNVV